MIIAGKREDNVRRELIRRKSERSDARASTP
jgi:hypothetical protein